LPVAIGFSTTTASTGVLTVNTVDKQVFCLKVVILCRFFLATVKELSREMAFKNFDKFTVLGELRDAAGF
jgi:hypothetical protein